MHLTGQPAGNPRMIAPPQVQAKLDTSMHEMEEYLKADETLEEANI